MYELIGLLFCQVAATLIGLFLFDMLKRWPKVRANEPLEAWPGVQERKSETEADDLDLIAQVRAASGSKVISELSGVAEASGDHTFDQMASQLLSVTRNIAGKLDESTAISPEKKAEIGALLKAAPGMIAKIAEMDAGALEALISMPSSSSEETQIRNHSQYLMSLLDELE